MVVHALMVSARVGLSLALILTIVTEMQASLSGVGFDILLAQRRFQSADLYANLILLGVMGFTVNQTLLLVERKLFKWKPR